MIYDHQFIQLRLSKGHIVANDIVLANSKSRTAILGNLRNNTYLTNARKILNIRFRQSNCLKMIDIPKMEETIPNGESKIRLPLKVFSLVDEQRIMIRPSKIMYFNRVAKTGSLGIAHLLADLGLKMDYSLRDLSANGEDLDGVQM